MVIETGVVLLKRISDRRLRMIYREDGRVVKHDFWYEKPAEGFVFTVPGGWVDPRSQEVHFSINMQSHGSRYDKDAGVVSLVSAKRSDYYANRMRYESIASLRNYQAALNYWKMCSHAIGDKLYYKGLNDNTRWVGLEEVERVLSREKAA